MMRTIKPCTNCGVLIKGAAQCAKCKTTPRGTRLSASQRGYNSEWRKVSRLMRQAQPWCSFCGLTFDLTVDHILPLSMGGTNETSNLRVLCRSCNSARRNT